MQHTHSTASHLSDIRGQVRDLVDKAVGAALGPGRPVAGTGALPSHRGGFTAHQHRSVAALQAADAASTMSASARSLVGEGGGGATARTQPPVASAAPGMGPTGKHAARPSDVQLFMPQGVTEEEFHRVTEELREGLSTLQEGSSAHSVSIGKMMEELAAAQSGVAEAKSDIAAEQAARYSTALIRATRRGIITPSHTHQPRPCQHTHRANALTQQQSTLNESLERTLAGVRAEIEAGLK